MKSVHPIVLSVSIVVSLLAACSGGGSGKVSLALVPSDHSYSRVRAATFDPVTGAVALAPTDVDDGAGAKSTDVAPVRFGGTSGLLLRDVGQLAIFGQDGLGVTRRIGVNDPGDTMSSNPQAVISVSDTKAYVVRLAKNSLLVIDPTKSGDAARTGTIDLSGFVDPADMDGHVDATAAVRVGSRVFVALGRYYFDSMFAIHYPVASLVVVIDTTTDTVIDTDTGAAGVQGIRLEQNGPVALALLNGKVYAASNGAYGMADGGIEAIDVGSYTSLTIVTEAALTPMSAPAADLSGLVAAGGKLVAIAGDRAVAIDPGVVVTPLVASGAMTLATAGGNDVVVGAMSRLFVYDVTTATDVTPPGTPASFDMMLGLGAMAGVD